MSSETPQAILDLVERQARAWERNDFGLGAGDWLPDGELVSPAGRVTADDLERELTEFHTASQTSTLPSSTSSRRRTAQRSRSSGSGR